MLLFNILLDSFAPASAFSVLQPPINIVIIICWRFPIVLSLPIPRPLSGFLALILRPVHQNGKL